MTPSNSFLADWLKDFVISCPVNVTSQLHLGNLWTYIKANHPKDFNLACMQFGMYRLAYDGIDGFKHVILFAVKEYVEYTPKSN